MDPFSSPMISQILAWIFSIPLICGILCYCIIILFTKIEGIPRIFIIWLLICLILFSPVRYIVLQLFLAVAFPYQSIVAFLSSIPLVIYIPIVFGILYAIGLGFPLFLTMFIAGTKEPISKGRLFLAGIAAPIIFLIFSTIFYNILPYAAYSTHWLGTKEIIRTTNGPSYYFYRYAVEQFTPLQFPGFTKDIGLQNMRVKERFRAHVAGVYCGDKHFWYYVSKTYPDYFEKLKNQNGE